MNLTNPQKILYWMMFSSTQAGGFTSVDRDILARNSCVFSSRKAISNALYQLSCAGYIVKDHDIWWITPEGEEYISKVINFKDSATGKKLKLPKAAKAPKASEWTDDDFGITPDVRKYIDKIEAENASLKQKLEEAYAKISTLQYDNELLAKDKVTLIDQCNELHKQLQAKSSGNASAAYAKAAEAFGYAIEAFKHLV